MQILFFAGKKRREAKGRARARAIFLDFTEVKRYSYIGRIYKAKPNSP